MCLLYLKEILKEIFKQILKELEILQEMLNLVLPILNSLYHFNCKNEVVKWTILFNPQYISKLLVTHFHTMTIKGSMCRVNPYCELMGKRFQLILLYSFCSNFGQIVGCSSFHMHDGISSSC